MKQVTITSPSDRAKMAAVPTPRRLPLVTVLMQLVAIVVMLCSVTHVTAATLIVDLQAPLIDNNIARFPVEAQFIEDNPGDLVQSVQIGLAIPTTNGNVNAMSFNPQPPFDNTFFFDFDAVDAAANEVNAFMSIVDLFNDGLTAGTHLLGHIEVNLLQVGIAVGDPLTIDITRLNLDHGTSAFFGNTNTLAAFDPVDIQFFDIGNNQDPNDDGRRTVIVPPRVDNEVPEPVTMTLLGIACVTMLQRRRNIGRQVYA